MREIDFRGISTRTGDLVYGNYFHNFRKGEGFNIIPFDTNEWIEVIPETVGQYTGLKDKNGVKIFEMDIVKTDDKLIFEVKWDDEWCGFNLIVDARPIEVFPYDSEMIEVIGNIHQNPELLS